MFWERFCPLETTFVLKEGDTETPYFWRMRAPTFRDEERVSRELRKKESADVFDIAAVEISAVFVESNFPAGNSPTLDPTHPDYIRALPEGASEQDVREYLGTMPSAIVYQLWEAVQEVAPNWGPTRFPGKTGA